MMKFKKYIWLILCSTVLLVGCEMPTNEVVAAIKECEDAGMKPIQHFNGLTYGTSKIVCHIIKEDN